MDVQSRIDQERTADDRRSRPRRWVLGLVAAAVVLLAVAVGAAVGMLTGPDATPGVAGQQSPTITPVARETDPTPQASPEPTPTEEVPTATPQQTSEPNAILPNRAIADIRVDQLNVREAGTQDAPVLGQLRAGARVFVIGSPATRDDMHWYRIAIVSGAYTGLACQSDFCARVGFVASPVEDDPWLREVEIGCPSSPMRIEELTMLAPLERLHCYEDVDIVITGTIDHPCCGYVGVVQHEPAWLATPGSMPYFRGGLQHTLLFRSDPATDIEWPERGDVIRATAHFDDPAAVTCRQGIDPQYADQEVEPGQVASAPEAVLVCRTQLVVSEYDVIDRTDLGPCCGSLDGRTAGRG